MIRAVQFIFIYVFLPTELRYDYKPTINCAISGSRGDAPGNSSKAKKVFTTTNCNFRGKERAFKQDVFWSRMN